MPRFSERESISELYKSDIIREMPKELQKLEPIKENLFHKLVHWIDDELSNTDPYQKCDQLICPDFFDCIDVSLIDLVCN